MSLETKTERAPATQSGMASINERADALGVVGLWSVVKDLEHDEPQSAYKPHLWPWSKLGPLILDAGAGIPMSEADRRVVILSNPGAPARHHATNTLYYSCSIYMPGENAVVHRHSPNASRFVLQGAGGYTTIEGEKCSMNRGDLIITPQGAWHNHGNEGTEPVIWVDVLDLPLVEALGSSDIRFDYVEPGTQSVAAATTPTLEQKVRFVPDHSINLYGTAGLTPTFVNHQRGESTGSPMFIYRWEQTRLALDRLRHYEGSPYDGIILEYTDPITGGPVMTTMSFHAQLLRPGETTRAHKQTSSTAYCCIEGSGRTVVGDTVLEWTENDMFVVPSWAPHYHVNSSASSDAVLYSVSDAPTLKKLSLYREQAV